MGARLSPRATRALTRTTDSRLGAGVPLGSALLPAGGGTFVGFGSQGDGLEVLPKPFEDPFGKGFAEVGGGGGEAGCRPQKPNPGALVSDGRPEDDR